MRNETHATHYWIWTRRCQPFCVCVRDSPLVRIKQSFCCCCTNVFFSYLYLIRYETTLIWLKFYDDVCSLKSNCHACIFCLLYGVFEIFINKIILSERYVCMRYKREPQAHAGMFFFFLCVGECVCMPNKKLHILSFLDEDSSCFFTL